MMAGILLDLDDRAPLHLLTVADQRDLHFDREVPRRRVDELRLVDFVSPSALPDVQK
jgi:hypothetical protein